MTAGHFYGYSWNLLLFFVGVNYCQILWTWMCHLILWDVRLVLVMRTLRANLRWQKCLRQNPSLGAGWWADKQPGVKLRIKGNGPFSRYRSSSVNNFCSLKAPKGKKSSEMQMNPAFSCNIILLIGNRSWIYISHSRTKWINCLAIVYFAVIILLELSQLIKIVIYLLEQELL